MESNGWTTIGGKRMIPMIKKRVLLFLLMMVSLVTATGVVHAAEGVGGQVSTGGKITFYEARSDTEETPDSSTPEKPGEETPPGGNNMTGNQRKPGGNLPNMGDVMKYFSIIGLGLILLVLLLWFIKDKTKEERGR